MDIMRNIMFLGISVTKYNFMAIIIEIALNYRTRLLFKQMTSLSSNLKKIVNKFVYVVDKELK